MITFTSAQLSAWYGALFWPLVRVLALLSTAPLLSHRAIPLRIKVGFGVAVSVIVMPTVHSPPIGDVLTAAGFALLLQNILIGVVIGFTVRLVFAALELAGELVGLQMGLSYAAFFNPSSGAPQNAVASFMSLLALLMFVAIDGHLMLIHALGESFRLFPLEPQVVAATPMTFDRIVAMAADIFAIGLSIALPFLAVMLLTNVVLGVLARVAPQLNIFAVGFPLTIVVGLVVLFLLLPYVETPLRAALERSVGTWIN
jgi:flagellar biosynthetic protein FliR